MKKIFLILAILNSNVFSSENDSLTNRYELKSNALSYINSHINEQLSLAAVMATKKDSTCQSKTILKMSKKLFVAGIRGAFIFSPMQRLLESEIDGLDITHIKMNKSIYKYVKKSHAPVLKLFSLSPTIRINNMIIGSDKFSHFFNLGWEYYSKMKKGSSLFEVLSYSKNLEERFWGGPTTGVISHADLMANFQGLRFFGHLSGKGLDPLTGRDNFESKYYSCEDGNWKRSREFSILEYFGYELDEGVNCNSYHSNKIERAINLSIKELENDGNSYSCPVLIDECSVISQKYDGLSEYLLSPKCF